MSQPHPGTPKLDLPTLRHQLLTPLNHIVGYSEMLLEDGGGRFDPAQQNLARIRQTAKEMVRMVQTTLTPRPGKRVEKIITELRYELAAPVHAILQAVGAVTGEAHQVLNVKDVLKIGRAAAELLSFSQGRMPGPPREAPRVAAGASEMPRATGRILIVEDNRANRQLLARQLKRQGHEVTEASSGSQALQLLVQSPQDVVLLDMLMPKLDGFQVLERIKSDPARREIPVIVISALDEVPGVVRCLEMGAEDYLFKPLNAVLLAARIQSSLERKRLHDLEKRRAEDLEQAYRRLHVSEERLRLAMRADRARMWDWDLNGNRVTEAGGREHSLEEALARVDDEDRARVREAVLEAVEKRQEFHCEFRLARATGPVRWMESMGRLEGGVDGRPPRMIGVTREITPRKRAEEELLRSNEEFQRFALAASHDLREPLRAVSTDLQALLERKQPPETARVIRSSAAKLGRMSKLIRDLLDYSQISGPKPPRRTIAAEAVLALVLSDLKLTLEESGAAVTHDPLPVVIADFVLLQRLFQNLISNSIKYRGKDPARIHIAARPEGSAWVFRVSDNGAGIDPQDQQAVFGPFQRAHGGKAQGTGLGLAICRRIVEQFGGKIWLESKPGKGSTFYFSIPES